MLIEERIHAMSKPISDCCAAIDAARVMATITGTPQVIYREFGNPSRWHVRSVDDSYGGTWVAMGTYEPGETRSNLGTDPRHTPELAMARGLLPYVHLDTLKAEYQRFLIGGPARPHND
jgi:hypothetical protein